MLIRVFKRSYVVQYIILLVIAVILWLPAFIYPPDFALSSNIYVSPAWHWLLQVIGNYPLAGTVLAIIIILTGALLMNGILEKYELALKNTLVPALFYILIMSHQPVFLQLHPALIASFLMLVVMLNLFGIYTQQEAYSQVFNSGFITGIASLFYFPATVFFLFIWLTFFVYRLYAIREWIIALLGFLLIYFFLGTYYFMTDQLIEAFAAYSEYFRTLPVLGTFYPFNILTLIISLLFILLFLFALFRLIAHLQEHVISVRKRYVSVFWFLVLAIANDLLFAKDLAEGSPFLLTGMLIVIIWSVLKTSKLRWYEWLTTIIILLIVVNNYYTLLFRSFINA